MSLFNNHGSGGVNRSFLSSFQVIKKNIYVKSIIYVSFSWFAITYLSHVFNIESIHQFNLRIASFFIELTYRPIRMVQDLKSSYLLSKDVFEENNRLKSSILALQHKNESLSSELQSLQHLEKLHSKITLAPEKKIVARVLGVKYSFSKASMILSLPNDLDQNVSSAMVFTDAGLVGRIYQSTSFNAAAIMITDHLSKIPVRCKRNGVQAILSGNGTIILDVDLVDSILDTNESSLCPDDILYTSGLDDVFFPDIPVAKIISIHDNEIKAKPIADLSTTQFVYVSVKTSTSQ